MRRSFVFPSTLALLAALLAGLASTDPRWNRWLDYRRQPLADGEWWRLATAHVMHLSIEHALLDIGALLLVAWIFATSLRMRGQVAVVAVAALVIDATLWLAHPEVDRYVGLSGVLHAWFVAGCVLWLFDTGPRARRRERRIWAVLLLAAIVVKLALEQRGDAFWLRASAFDVVTAAHRAGAAAGLLWGLSCGLFGEWMAARRMRRGALR